MKSANTLWMWDDDLPNNDIDENMYTIIQYGIKVIRLDIRKEIKAVLILFMRKYMII